MESEENKNNEIVITKNVITRGQHFGYPDWNWIEAIIVTSILVYILFHIGLTKIALFFFCLVLIPFTMLVFVRGIHKHSFTRMLIAEMRFLARRRKSHLRGPQYVIKKSRYTNNEGTDGSEAQKVWERIKHKLFEFADQYDKHEEESSQADQSEVKRRDDTRGRAVS